MFNAFHFGGYIEWRDFPRRAPIVDGRGHADGGLLEEIHFARVYPQHLERLRERYGLDAAVMDYPSYSGARVEDVLGPDADAALASPDWALVYWDDVALVYLPRRGRHAATIARDEYRLVKPANGAAGIARLMEDPSRAPAVRAELARNVRETGSSLGWLLSGYAAPDSDAAIAAFERVRDPGAPVRGRAGASAPRTGVGRTSRARPRRSTARSPARRRRRSSTTPAWSARRRATIGARSAIFAALSVPIRVWRPSIRRSSRPTGGSVTRRAPPISVPAFLAAATRAKLEQHVAAALRLMSAGRTAEADGEVAAALRARSAQRRRAECPGLRAHGRASARRGDASAAGRPGRGSLAMRGRTGPWPRSRGPAVTRRPRACTWPPS